MFRAVHFPTRRFDFHLGRFSQNTTHAIRNQTQNARMDATSPSRKSGHSALRRGRREIAQGIYHVTATTLKRKPVFADFNAAHAAARSFGIPALLGDATLLAWVLMPDHAHWLVQLGETGSLACVVSRLKSASARLVNQACHTEGTIWARAFHDHAMRHDEDVQAVARYIVCNPVRANLVERVGDYPYWNAVWL